MKTIYIVLKGTGCSILYNKCARKQSCGSKCLGCSFPIPDIVVESFDNYITNNFIDDKRIIIKFFKEALRLYKNKDPNKIIIADLLCDSSKRYNLSLVPYIEVENIKDIISLLELVMAKDMCCGLRIHEYRALELC